MSRLTRAVLAVLLAGGVGYGVYRWSTQDAQDADVEVVRVAFWNIRDLSASSRDDTERDQICEVLEKFDAIAICEVNDQQILEALEATLDATGEDWESITSEKVGTTSGTQEHYSVIYREAIFDQKWTRQLPDKALSDLDLGIPDPDYADLTVDPDLMFDREPFAVCLKTEDSRLDFVLVVVHVTWGSHVGPRVCEVRALKTYYDEVFPDENDVLICGDLNRKADDDESLGWLKRIAGLVTTTVPSVPTHISSNTTYDHIAIHPQHTTEYAGTHGVLAFDETMFGNDDAAANLALSDHRPVWIALTVPAADDDQDATPEPPEDPIVYVTPTGTKYHRLECPYLSENRTAIRLSEARVQGYAPCSRCGPPE